MSRVKAVATQEYDFELTFTADCEFDPVTRVVSGFGPFTRPDGRSARVDVITDEFVTLGDGRVLSEFFDGVRFDHGSAVG